MTLLAYLSGGGRVVLHETVGETEGDLRKWVAAAARDKTLTGAANTLDEVWVPLASGGVLKYGHIAMLEQRES